MVDQIPSVPRRDLYPYTTLCLFSTRKKPGSGVVSVFMEKAKKISQKKAAKSIDHLEKTRVFS
jgi:hypothetical protein